MRRILGLLVGTLAVVLGVHISDLGAQEVPCEGDCEVEGEYGEGGSCVDFQQAYDDYDDDGQWDALEPWKHATEGPALPSGGNWTEWSPALNRRVSHSDWREGLVTTSSHPAPC
jgi:hypothetical protein